ncbi:MAG TPA: hypothetical protein VN894_21245, partial [Polyangiaceae bacterium]|nr:hypothetical protein [Polyangiaceae bacterium]
MRHARNVGLALVALLVLVFGVRALVRAFDTGVRRPAPWSGAASLVTEPHTTMSIAKFSNGDTLDNCADVTFGERTEIDAKRLEARGFSILQTTCAETFPNSVALASCTRSDLDSDAQPPTRAVGYYYDPATLQGDETYSGQCLGNG